MITEALDFKYLLLENYKKLKISETELATILMIDHLLSEGNKLITADLLSLKMSLDVKEIDAVLANLLKKGYLEFITKNGKTASSIKPLQNKLFAAFESTYVKENDTNNDEDKKEVISNAIKEFETLFERTLSPVEKSKIKEWVISGYSEDSILNALKESVAANKKTIRHVDKLLLMWATREERETEGHSTLGKDDWDKNLEETIRIAKTPWIKKDDDK